MARATADLEQALATAGFLFAGDGRRGATATVYPARTAAGLAVAVKVLDPDTDLYTLQREASILAAIDHPGVVAIVDYGRLTTGQLYLASRWIDGTTMARRMAEGGLPSTASARHIVAQLADALDHVHHAGVVHRDLSPANILIGADDRLTLIDFGIARVGDERTTTARAELIGTTRYMAPELISGSEPSPAADQYAAAVILYELMAGQWPYDESATVANVFHQHLHQDPVPLTERVPTAAPGIEAALERALSKDPADRFPTMGDFAEAALDTESQGRAADRRRGVGSMLFTGLGVAAVAAVVIGGALIAGRNNGADLDGGGSAGLDDQAAATTSTDLPDSAPADTPDSTSSSIADNTSESAPVGDVDPAEEDAEEDADEDAPAEADPGTLVVETGDSTPVVSDWPAGLASELECNLIAAAPGFESDAVPENFYLNPTEPGREDRVRVVPGSGEDGTNALAVGIDGGFGLFGHIVEIEPERRYVFSVSAAVAGDPSVIEFGVEWLDTEYQPIDLPPAVADPSIGAPGRVTMTTPPAPANAGYAVTRVYKDSSSGVLLVDELVFTDADAGCVDLLPPSN